MGFVEIVRVRTPVAMILFMIWAALTTVAGERVVASLLTHLCHWPWSMSAIGSEPKVGMMWVRR
jgi:hypothetical protein